MSFTAEEPISAEFLRVWPIERLRSMSLAEYTQSGDKNCFTYWIEAKLSGQGSIWGGSAFKFGIYSRRKTAEETAREGRSYDAEYGWYTKFGKTSAAAFKVVRGHVVRIAEAARSGRLEDIDGIPLGDSVKWKIAYHYQDQSNPQIVCIFLKKVLLDAAGRPASDRKAKISELQRSIAGRNRPGESTLQKSSRIWREYAMSHAFEIRLTDYMLRNGLLTMNASAAPFPEIMHGGQSANEAGTKGHFALDSGETFESDFKVSESGGGTIRHNFLKYLTDTGARAGDFLVVNPRGELEFYVHRKNSAGELPEPPVRLVKENAPLPYLVRNPPPLNQILYGPPGTGKTYCTIDKALEILDPAFQSSNAQNRNALKKRYDELEAERVVQFVTFHQSFSYEDFVEGLRAATDEETKALSYEIADGVFKTLCASARTRVVGPENVTVNPTGKRIWKLSLGNSYTEQHIFEECIANNYLLVGFGAGGDFSAASNRTDIEKTFVAAGGQPVTNDYNITAINLFAHQMKVGDLVVVTEGNLKFRAIGEVTGEYEYLPRDGRDTYAQCRRVRWLRVYRPALPYDQLMDNRFSQMTMYELREGSINLTKLRKLLEPNQEKVGPAQPRVLIIDEINRGNVSRIFGELITLIEPSKRDGADEALKVKLPYSKEEFTVPGNVYLIGTMNTADRSLSGVDIALRRRFQFVEMAPQPKLLEDRNIDGINLAALLETINRRIEVLLDRDHQIGHAYFMSLRDNDPIASLADIFQYQVLPLLQEYFFEDWQRIAWVLNDHRKDKQYRFVDRSGVSIESLFGNAAGVPANGDTWFINRAAFGLVESYRGILSLG